MSWKGHEHFLFLFSGRRQEFAKRRTANSCNARDDYVQTSLTLIVVAVPANTNGFSHLYTNPPVISPLWRSLPALPIPTTGRRSVGQKTAYHASLLSSTFGPCIRHLKCVKMGTLLPMVQEHKGGERSSWTTGGKDEWQNCIQEVNYLY